MNLPAGIPPGFAFYPCILGLRGLLDYGARMYDPIIARWFNIDPLAEKYYSVSPYAFTLNNPMKYIDPNGMDVWELDMYGNIRERIEDTSQDAFYMVERNSKGKWERVGEGRTFEYGTVNQETRSFKNGNVSGQYDVYTVKGDENGKALFEFMANNITGSPSQVEIGQIVTGDIGDNGVNYITTSHTKSTDYGMGDLLVKDLYGNNSMREINHSHHTKAGASGDRETGDYAFATYVVNKILPPGAPEPKFQIYHVPTKAYLRFIPFRKTK